MRLAYTSAKACPQKSICTEFASMSVSVVKLLVGLLSLFGMLLLPICTLTLLPEVGRCRYTRAGSGPSSGMRRSR